MSETSKILCKVCKQIKTRILDGKYPDGRNKRWVDENGWVFNGKTCGQCNLIRIRERMKNLREKRNKSNENL